MPKTKKSKGERGTSAPDEKWLWSIRLNDSISQLAQATTELSVGVAAHTQRLDNVEKQHQQQRDEYLKQQEQYAEDYKYLDQRITTVQSELVEKVTESTEHLTKHIDATLENFTDKLSLKDAEIAKRVDHLETWRTLIAGGSVVVMFIITALLLKLLTSLFSQVHWLSFLGK